MDLGERGGEVGLSVCYSNPSSSFSVFSTSCVVWPPSKLVQRWRAREGTGQTEVCVLAVISISTSALSFFSLSSPPLVKFVVAASSPSNSSCRQHRHLLALLPGLLASALSAKINRTCQFCCCQAVTAAVAHARGRLALGHPRSKLSPSEPRESGGAPAPLPCSHCRRQRRRRLQPARTITPLWVAPGWATN
jgi:hypothetical protein